MNRRHWLAVTLVAALVSFAGATAWGIGQEDAPPTPTPPAEEVEQGDGEVIRIGEPQTEDLGPNQGAANAQRLLTVPGDPRDLRQQRAAVSSYFIGLGAVPVDPALRAHVDLPE